MSTEVCANGGSCCATSNLHASNRRGQAGSKLCAKSDDGFDVLASLVMDSLQGVMHGGWRMAVAPGVGRNHCIDRLQAGCRPQVMLQAMLAQIKPKQE